MLHLLNNFEIKYVGGLMLDHAATLTPNLQLAAIQKMAMQPRHVKGEGKMYHLFRAFCIALSHYFKAKSSLTFVFACNHQEIIKQGELVSQLSFV